MTAPSLVRAVALTSSSSQFTASALVDLSTSVSMKEYRLRAYRLEAEAATRPATLVKPTILMPPISATSPGLAPSTLPPRSTARSTSTEPGLIVFTISAETRSGPARDQRGSDDDVLLLDVLGGQRGLLGLILFRHFLGVAAGGLRVLEFLVLDRQELGP